MSTAAPAAPRRQLSLVDSTAIIVGIVIGAGIYETTPAVAANAGSVAGLFGLWLLGGVLSLIGAACYAELATRYPRAGGDYVFLREAYGEGTGFMFAWTAFWVTQPANSGALAYIFGRYAYAIVPHGERAEGTLIYALASIVVLTAVNVLGVRSGKWTQNLLSGLKVLGLLVIVAAGLLWVRPPSGFDRPATGTGEPSIALAMILVLFTYGGWRVISYVAAEVIEPEKNILRALMLGTGAVALLYLLVNYAFCRALGFEGLIASRAVAADTLARAFGAWAAIGVSLLVCITCLGNINAMLFANARVFYALGQDHRALRWLGRWHPRLDAPVHALLVQTAVTLAMVFLLAGGSDAFERLVVLSAPIHWFFFLLSGAALMVLRRRVGAAAGVYRVPLYPLTPLIFCVSTALMLVASMVYAWGQRHWEGWWIAVVIAAGLMASRLRRETLP